MWVNRGRTLWADRNFDTWQLPLISADGAYCGNVVEQIVDPAQCLVRYFVIFSQREARRFLLPSDSVSKIDSVLHCALRSESLQKIPPYHQRLPRALELEIFKALGQIPDWLGGIYP